MINRSNSNSCLHKLQKLPERKVNSEKQIPGHLGGKALFKEQPPSKTILNSDSEELGDYDHNDDESDDSDQAFSENDGYTSNSGKASDASLG